MATSVTTSFSPSAATSRPFLAISVGGLIVGILDLAYAIVVYTPKHPILVPQTIASGVLGAKSYREGMQSAVLGVFLHFVIAFGAAAAYYLASRKLSFLVSRPVFWGIVYGGWVYIFMHIVVLPLSAVPHGHPRLLHQVTEFIEHWFFVGLPISLSVRHYSR
jgi:hypothetical protein